MNKEETRAYHQRLRREYRAMLGCLDDPDLPLPIRGDEEEDPDEEDQDEDDTLD